MDRLLVFVEYPHPGEVKTRLAETVGAERAAELCCDWIGNVFEIIQPLRPDTVQVIGYYFGASEEEFAASWPDKADEWWPQPDGDVGARLSAGFERAHQDEGKVLAIGTDCLELNTDLLRMASDQLDQREVVFGPTRSGGYYLIGTKTHRPGLFEGVRWSSKFTLADNLSNCRENHWSVALVPPRASIDSWEDWLSYCERHDLSP